MAFSGDQDTNEVKELLDRIEEERGFAKMIEIVAYVIHWNAQYQPDEAE